MASQFRKRHGNQTPCLFIFFLYCTNVFARAPAEAIPKGDAVSRFYEIFQLKRRLPKCHEVVRRQKAPRKYIGAGEQRLATTSIYEMYGREFFFWHAFTNSERRCILREDDTIAGFIKALCFLGIQALIYTLQWVKHELISDVITVPNLQGAVQGLGESKPKLRELSGRSPEGHRDD